jgi:hypothetical protein
MGGVVRAGFRADDVHVGVGKAARRRCVVTVDRQNVVLMSCVVIGDRAG